MSVCLYPPSNIDCQCICHRHLGNINCLVCNCREHQELTSLKARLKEVERFQDITHQQYMNRKKPHKCPVCEGSGKLWSQGVIGYDRCNPCEGKGIVWG